MTFRRRYLLGQSISDKTAHIMVDVHDDLGVVDIQLRSSVMGLLPTNIANIRLTFDQWANLQDHVLVPENYKPENDQFYVKLPQKEFIEREKMTSNQWLHKSFRAEEAGDTSDATLFMMRAQYKQNEEQMDELKARRKK